MDFEIRLKLLNSMFDIVEKEVNHFKNDFACYDVPKIVENNNDFVKAYWFVRNCGTDLWYTYYDEPTTIDTEILSLYAGLNEKVYSFTNVNMELVLEDINVLRNLTK